MKFKNILLYSLLFLTISCKVTFVPPQSKPAMDLLDRIQHNATAIWTSADLSYSGNESNYTLVSNEIDSLINIDRPRKKALLVSLDNTLHVQLNELSKEHQSAGNISKNVQANYNSIFKSLVHARSISENSLKP